MICSLKHILSKTHWSLFLSLLILIFPAEKLETNWDIYGKCLIIIWLLSAGLPTFQRKSVAYDHHPLSHCRHSLGFPGQCDHNDAFYPCNHKVAPFQIIESLEIGAWIALLIVNIVWTINFQNIRKKCDLFCVKFYVITTYSKFKDFGGKMISF